MGLTSNMACALDMRAHMTIRALKSSFVTTLKSMVSNMLWLISRTKAA